MELFYNDVTEINGFYQYLVLSYPDIRANFATIFSSKERGIEVHTKFMVKGLQEKSNGSIVERFNKFIYIANYDYNLNSCAMSLLTTDNMDTFLDSIKTMKERNWNSSYITKMGNLIQEIMKDKEAKDIKLTKHQIVL